MARFRTTSAFWSGQQRVPAGKTVADSQADALPGDFVWPQLTAASLPAGFTPLDSSAQSMRAASQWANTPIANVCLGSDSVDG